MRLRDKVRPHLLPALRFYVQNVPFGKRAVWNAIAPRLKRLSLEFDLKTLSGFRMTGQTKDLIDRFIYYLGVWEPNLSAFLGRTLTQGDTFIDVGANVGYYSLLASGIVGDEGRIVAIEPSPAIYRTLCDHLDMNQVTNARAIHAAASDEPGELTIHRGPERNRGRASIRPVGEVEAVVPADRLDAFLTDAEVRNARVVKIDVEGAEAMVVKGLGRLLTEGRTDLLIVLEIAPHRIGRDATDEIMATFAAHGFNAYALANDYEIGHNLPPHRPAVPTRVEEVTELTDVVFSRTDAPTL